MVMVPYRSASFVLASTLLLGGTLGTQTAIAQDPELVGTVWELQQILYNNDTLLEPANPEDYTIEFFEDGTIGVVADCNVVGGTYDPESSDFITLGPSTLAACPPDSIDDEYREGLESAVIYFFQDGDLYMDLPVDTGTMMFSPAMETAEVEEPEVEEEVEEPEVVEEEIIPEAGSSVEPEPVRGLW